MSTFLQRLAVGALAIAGSVAEAQETLPVPPAREVQTKLREWVETRKAISAETSGWSEEKSTLSELNGIRKHEAAQLDEFVAAAGARVDELSEKRAAFDEEKALLQQSRREFEKRIAEYEKRLRPLFPQFPPPLREKIEEAVIRLEEPEPDCPLQDRTRDVLLISQAWLDFHRNITIDSEIREIDGEKREVEILYLGMSRAFFVDQSGRFSGYGVPAADGWKWIDDPSLSGRVRLAIEVHARREPPQFVELPFE